MSFEEKNLDVLQNIEFAIQSVYKVQKNLIDYDVTFALESIIDFYSAENIGREPRDFNLSEKSEMVYEFVKEMCDFRLGKSPLEDDEDNFIEDSVSIKEILNCLKKIKNSVSKWTKRNGRTGYLDFVKDYMPNV
ncbi:MAG: hypothetical protein WAT71_15860 [Ignavibacteria bacterium]